VISLTRKQVFGKANLILLILQHYSHHTAIGLQPSDVQKSEIVQVD
jgi:hypothetical protein